MCRSFMGFICPYFHSFFPYFHWIYLSIVLWDLFIHLFMEFVYQSVHGIGLSIFSSDLFVHLFMGYICHLFMGFFAHLFMGFIYPSFHEIYLPIIFIGFICPSFHGIYLFVVLCDTFAHLFIGFIGLYFHGIYFTIFSWDLFAQWAFIWIPKCQCGNAEGCKHISIFTGPTNKLLWSFTVISDVYRHFTPNKTTFT